MAFDVVGGDVNSCKSVDIIYEQTVVDDLSIVPLERHGFGICECCGRVGRVRDFYIKNNKVCSLQCHKSCTSKRHRYNWKFKLMEGTEHMEGMIPLEPLPQLQQWHATLNDLIQAGPIKPSAAHVAHSYEWKDELFGCDFLAAPVSLFKHAPLHDMWDSTFEGMKVEVKNTDCENTSEKLGDYFWVATVLKVQIRTSNYGVYFGLKDRGVSSHVQLVAESGSHAVYTTAYVGSHLGPGLFHTVVWENHISSVKGYMGLLRYEGFGSDDSKDFWVNLCCSEVHPVGWCATRGKPLIPPKSIEDKYTDWKKFLVKQLTGARTLPANFYNKLNDCLASRFTIGSIMEVVDKNRISQVKVASVVEIIGKRLHIKYYDSSPEDNGFWCHEDSPLIHPVGWAFRVGHPLDAPQSYCQRVAAGRLIPHDTTLEQFYKYPTNEPPLFAEGMKLEAIDPLNLSAVCAATVMQILNEGYMMIRIDCYPADATAADWFCYHQRSPCIFPVGFALANNIPLVPPSGLSAEEFNWETYLAVSGSRAANRALFGARGHVVSHGFVAGMRLECADLMDPRLVCVATIARVVADLLKVHFDGWGTEYDQWLWAHSTDMYPVGWCRAVGHRLEGPLQPPPRAIRKQTPKQPKRRRRQPAPKVASQPPNTTEDSSQNSDMGDTKSLSPPTSVSVDTEISADAEPRPEVEAEFVTKMEVDESKETEQTVEIKEDSMFQDIPLKEPPEENESSQASSEEPLADFNELPREDDDKVIPRLVNTSVPLDILNSVDPENWSTTDVAKFLTVNGCQPYCVNFANITGPMMLQLTKDEIIELLEMKVGPSLKIFDLIQQLKCKIKQPQCRLLGSFNK